MSPAASRPDSGLPPHHGSSPKRSGGIRKSSSDVPSFTFSFRGTVLALLAGAGVLMTPVALHQITHYQTSSHVKHPKLKGPKDIKQMLDDIVAQDTSLFRQLMENTTKIYQNNGQNLSPELVHAFAIASSRLQLAAAMVNNGSITSAELWNALQSPESSIIPPKSGLYFRKYGTIFHAEGSGINGGCRPESISFTDPHTCNITNIDGGITGHLTVSPQGDGKSLVFSFEGVHIHPDQSDYDINLSRGKYSFTYQTELYTNEKVQKTQ